MGEAGEPDLYLDIATGQVHCIGCEISLPIEDWNHFCNCGAVYRGGEIWQGMSAEIGRVGDLSWLKAAGITRGEVKIDFRGWWFCLACRKESDRTRQFFGGPMLGTGGLCRSCEEIAGQRLAPWFSFWAVRQPCSWCKQRRGRVVLIEKARICKPCTENVIRPMPEDEVGISE